MTPKWTPGPWRVGERCQSNGDQPDGGYVSIDGGHWFSFATVVVQMRGDEERFDNPQGIANAALISAAPELFEALEALLKTISTNGEWDDGCFYYNRTSASELQSPIAQARAALAKANPPEPRP